MSCFTLMYYAVLFKSDHFGLVGFAADYVEQGFIIFIAIILLFTSFNMFLLKECRKQTREILCCKDNRKKTYYGLMNVNK